MDHLRPFNQLTFRPWLQHLHLFSPSAAAEPIDSFDWIRWKNNHFPLELLNALSKSFQVQIFTIFFEILFRNRLTSLKGDWLFSEWIGNYRSEMDLFEVRKGVELPNNRSRWLTCEPFVSSWWPVDELFFENWRWTEGIWAPFFC